VRPVAVRILAAVGVVLLCTSAIWLLLHWLRPEAFQADGALLPALVMAGATANVILLNMVLVERAFSVTGVFQHLNRAMDTGDWPILFALTIEGAIIVCAFKLLADLALMAVDPRVRRPVTAL
jgi:peptide/nickel transport system permease protein